MDKPPMDRLPPNSPEAERGVLGCILLDPQAAMPDCIDRFKDPEVFYDLKNRQIYQTMLELYDDRDPVDIITLTERLSVWDLLNEVGGMAYISTLPDGVPSAANVSYYADIVREKAMLRRMIQVCTSTVSAIYDFEGDVDKLMDEVERDILRVSESRVIESTKDIKELVSEALQDIEVLMKREGDGVTGIATGFIDLDRLTNGLQPADMIVIAARPSVGKTSLAMNIAETVAVKNKIPAGVFSLEMKNRALVQRMICSLGAVNVRNLRDGFGSEEDFTRLTYSSSQIAKAPLYIDDTAGLSILQLRAKARRMWQRFGIKLFIIDYLQLLNAIGGKRKAESRQQEVADISSGIKALAKELNVPVIVLSQLNRDIERDKNRKPRLADLRESGAIEQDADVVGLLYKTMSAEMERTALTITCNLDIAKQRNGPTGEIPLVFMKSFTRFESAAKVSPADVPQNEPSQQELT